MFKKIALVVTGVLGLLLTFGSEDAYETTLTNQNEERPTVVMSHNSWDDGIGTTAVVANVLRDEGFEVEFVQLDPAILFSSIATGDSDVSVVPWSMTHSPYMEEYGDRIDNMGPHAEGAANGAVVPAYMEDVNHIEDLTDEANQTFTSIEPGAVIVEQAQTAIDTYDNLSGWTVQPSSTGAMLTELRQAYENEEEIVMTGWTPHWKFVEFDLKMLEEPAGAFETGEDLIKIAREGFREDNPIAYQIIDNFSWSIEDVQQVMTYLQDDEVTPTQAARRWMDDNPEKVAEWTEGVEGLSDE
jgi:glycine betaine/proline transport system substrate-binding protein